MGAVEIVGLLSGVLQLAANAGVDYESISSEIAKAQAGGHTLSAAQLQTLANQWHTTDQAEQSAYDKRMNQGSVNPSSSAG